MIQSRKNGQASGNTGQANNLHLVGSLHSNINIENYEKNKNCRCHS